eukprot:scaffold295_cov97-Alexandrium_tamarense.AAC.2
MQGEKDGTMNCSGHKQSYVMGFFSLEPFTMTRNARLLTTYLCTVRKQQHSLESTVCNKAGCEGGRKEG